ncbi:protein of unknown function DUF589 [gamma proteobacterium HdN1]|nr:protein of unknown function DUF589 [gamma proteobacterium HdN1]
MAYWVFKTEPNVFSIDDLKARDKQGEIWDGVRNYQARNMLRDDTRVGDLVFVYHSNCKIPGIYGIGRIIETKVVDPTQFLPESHYFDLKSSPDAPRWFTVKLAYERHLERPITLTELKDHPELQEMQLVKRGNRLSILPVSNAQWAIMSRLL